MTVVTQVQVARQPILDGANRLFAYELLYRAGAGGGEPDVASGDASSQTIVDSVLSIGLDRIGQGRTVIMKMSRKQLVEGAAALLDPAQVILGIVDSVRPTADVLEACRRLKERGFKLALDAFVFSPEYGELLSLVDIVKIDVLSLTRQELEEQIEQLKPWDVRLLADKVESKEDHADCKALGFELFQGFNLFKPQTLTGRQIATQALTVVRLLNLINGANVPDRKIEEAFSTDPTLSYKLLRMVNSASMGGRGIESIGHALRLLGRSAIHRWLSLILATQGSTEGDARSEIVKSALTRARLAERIPDLPRRAGAPTLPASETLFMTGLFSRMDALLEVPMQEIVDQIHLREEVRLALLHQQGLAGSVLEAVDAYEAADWPNADRALESVGTEPHGLSDAFLDALSWASDRINAAR